jgi:hypothetical protein
MLFVKFTAGLAVGIAFIWAVADPEPIARQAASTLPTPVISITDETPVFNAAPVPAPAMTPALVVEPDSGIRDAVLAELALRLQDGSNQDS